MNSVITAESGSKLAGKRDLGKRKRERSADRLALNLEL
jgi:hypothetical protein